MYVSRLGLPAVTHPQLDRTLAEAGEMIATGDRDRTVAALDRLSLLNDRRAVPLYARAFAISDYAIKYRIIDSLGTLLGNSPAADADEVMSLLARAFPGSARLMWDRPPTLNSLPGLRQSSARRLSTPWPPANTPKRRNCSLRCRKIRTKEVRNLASRYLAER